MVSGWFRCVTFIMYLVSVIVYQATTLPWDLGFLFVYFPSPWGGRKSQLGLNLGVEDRLVDPC